MSPSHGLIQFLTYRFPFLKDCFFSFVSDESVLYLHCNSTEQWDVIYHYRDRLAELDINIKNIVVTRPRGTNIWINMGSGNVCE